MYIPYNKIAQLFKKLFPFCKDKVSVFIEKLRINQNINYIAQNKNKVLKKLRKKIKNEKLIVAFYVYDDTKWKCQSVYDLMDKSEHFIPYIFVTKNASSKNSSSYQAPELVRKTYEFFKNNGMRVLYHYDIENEKFIATKDMTPRPDIIFYQHPWFVETSQGPVRTSEFALTYYVPYFIATSQSPIEYYLRFHKYVEHHYVLNNQIKEYFSQNMENNGSNLVAAGHPQLDYFYLNKNKNYEDKNYVIYAPHWSINEQTNLKWGTFLWSGEFMLDFAKKHPEYNWIFKPHPNLKPLLKLRHWNDTQVQSYWNEWEKIGYVCESGNYLDTFMQSKMMITDCGSFQTEYFMTHKPCIYLKSDNGTPFNPSVQAIVDNYYTAKNPDELSELLNKVLINDEDTMQEQRLNVYNSLGYGDNYAAENIINDILKTLKVKK